MFSKFYFNSPIHKKKLKTESLSRHYVNFSSEQHLPKNTVANMIAEYFIRHRFVSYTTSMRYGSG